VLGSEHLELDAVFTHFATADDPASTLFDEQRLRFERVARRSAGLGRAPAVPARRQQRRRRARPPVWFDRVRPGLLLYGIVPPPLTSTIGLTPVMTLASRAPR